MESFRKDQQVQQLQQQLGSLESQVSQQPPVVMGVDQEMTAKLVQLETEVAAKKEELEKLKEEVNVTIYCKSGNFCEFYFREWC